MVWTQGVEVEDRQQSVVGHQGRVGVARMKTWLLRPLGCRLDIAQMAEVEGIHLVAPRAARVHLAFAVLAEAVVSENGVVQHAMTWCGRDPERNAGFANSSSGSAPRVVRRQRCQNMLHLAAWRMRVREAGNSGYVGPPNPPYSRFINDQERVAMI